MSPNRTTIDAARAAKDQAKRSLAGVPGIAGIGLTRQGEGYAVKVNLQEDRQQLIPHEVAGVPVVVEVVGRIVKRA